VPGTKSFMEKTNLQITPKNKCRGKIINLQNHKTIPYFCWSCGHYAERIGKNCNCCGYQITRKDQKLLQIKTRLDEIVARKTEPEYRFYTQSRCFWIKQSDLDQYQNLPNIEKQEKYYWFIQDLLNHERLTWVLRL